jgi:hypothetical protein
MTRCATLTLLLLAAIALADKFDTWFGQSPDKKLLAVERRIPDATAPSRLDLDGFTVFVCSSKDGIQRDVIAQHTFPGRVVSQMRWSPDSQFLLFTTASSGGHSPWHFKTYVYCVADKSFRDVESAAGGSIGAAEFRFEPPDVAVLQLHQPDSDTTKPIKIALGKAMQHMDGLQ